MSEKEVLVPEVIEKNITEMASDASMEEALAVIENRGRLWDKVMETAIKSTKSRHWVDFGGKPYLEAAGAEGVARRFNLNIYDQAMDGPTYHEDGRGRYYMFICTGKCGFPGHREYIEAVGSCSSRDKFFGTVSHWEGNEKITELKEIEDVDMRNVRQKAYTNFVANAVTRFLGMRDLTWEELAKYGIRKEGKTSVAFKTKTSSAPAGTSSPTPSQGTQASKPSKPNGKPDNPMWVWDASDGSKWISARLGTHFADSFLKGCGMRSGKKPEIFSAKYSDSLLEVLNAQLAKANEPVSDEDVNDIFPPEVGSNG